MAQPKYQLLQQWLRDQINSGEYTANQQIPTELELAEQFGYSRQTIRQAISRCVSAFSESDLFYAI